MASGVPTPAGVRRVAMAAVAFSALYLLSDLIEDLQDGFSTPQLLLTLIAEAAVPVFVIGLYRAQRPEIGRLGLVCSVAYAYAYVFFTATVVYALVDDTPDYATLTDDLGALMTLHGTIMVIAGVGLGIAVVRAGVLPAWTGILLMAGVVLVAATQDATGVVPLFAAAVRATAFAGMGAALLLPTTTAPRASSPTSGPLSEPNVGLDAVEGLPLVGGSAPTASLGATIVPSTADLTTDVTTPTLYVCHVDTKLPRLHPCAKADAALTDAGIAHDRIVYGQGKPFGIGTKGTRSDLAELSGQEKLPVLVLPGGETIAGSAPIIRWAQAQS